MMNTQLTGIGYYPAASRVTDYKGEKLAAVCEAEKCVADCEREKLAARCPSPPTKAPAIGLRDTPVVARSASVVLQASRRRRFRFRNWNWLGGAELGDGVGYF